MSDFTPTEEQLAALDLFRTGSNLSIEAGAGTGKTSSLQLLANDTTRRGQYLAFNRAIVNDAGAKMPGSVQCSTAHSLAYRSVIGAQPEFARRLRSSARMKSIDIARRLRIDPLVVTYGIQRKPMAAGYLAGLVMRSVLNFCHSADLEPGPQHVPYIDGIDLPTTDGKRTWFNNNEVRSHVMPAVRRAWADVMDPKGELNYRHDFYLKAWHLSDPTIAADYILFDEAQDANPILQAIVMAQTHAQIVAVGDTQQQIYAFLGTGSCLEALREAGGATTYLTRSFRFGDAIAAVANGILERLHAPLQLVGSPGIASVVADVAQPDVILTRTNAEAVRTLLLLQAEGKKVALVGGSNEVLTFAKAAEELMEGRWVSHPELACFQDWNEVRDYAERDEMGGELRLMVSLIDQFGTDVIIAALGRDVDEAKADVTVSTAHKSKGREWNSVQLAADFTLPKSGGDASPDELRLLYVACTRAKRELDVTAVPHALAAPEGTEDALVLPAWLQTDDAPVSVPTAPQEPTPIHKACPLCGRTDIIRGGLVGAHKCAGATA